MHAMKMSQYDTQIGDKRNASNASKESEESNASNASESNMTTR